MLTELMECRQCNSTIREYFENGTCSVCEITAKYLQENECKPCQENCVECENGEECKLCNGTEFFVVSDNKTCRQCDAYVREYYNNGTCDFCPDGNYV